MIKVFKMNECDWVAAESMESAKAYMREIEIEIEDTRELTDVEMLRLKHTGCDGEYEKPITFKAELEKNIAEGVEFPCHFATTEI